MNLKIKAVSPKIGTDIPFPFLRQRGRGRDGPVRLHR